MTKKLWGLFWTVMTLLGGFAVWTVWQRPSESKSVFLWGMSKSKLAFLAGMVLLCLCCLSGAVLSFLDRKNAFSSGKAAGIASFILLFLLVLGRIFLTPPVGKTALERSLSERLLPFALWAAAFTLLAVMLLIFQKSAQLWAYQTSSVPALIWGGIFFFLMAGAVIYAFQSGVGLDVISGTFYRQGVSLLEGHLVVPLLFLFPLLPLITLLSTKITDGKEKTIIAAIFCVLIWSAAVRFWQTTVFEGRSYFAPALRPPNYNYYPASDAENYDLLAQSLLLGNGFRNGLTVVRPLYAAFLALLHFIFGNNYIELTDGQILVLAITPVLIYLIGRTMSHTSGAVLAAVWVIWREIYSIRVTPLVQVSNSRLLMSDLPTMLLTAAVIFCIVRWYRYDKEETRALLSGGMAGTCMLLRTQCFVLLPAMWLVFFTSRKKVPKKWLSLLFSLLGFALVFAPWTVWGKLHPNTTVNEDVSEDRYLLSLYRKAAGEPDSDAGLFQLFMEHPADIVHAVGSHFLNNEISSLLILPVRITKPAETGQLFYEEDLFWYRENARETIEKNPGLIALYLLIIAFGVISAVRKNGFGGLIPFLVHIVYNLGNAFALTSGFRFILPVDWIILLYFAFGCTAVMDVLDRICLFDDPAFDLCGLRSGVSGTKESRGANRGNGQGWAFAGAFVMLAMIGAVLPLCETVIPRRFVQKTSDEIKTEWQASGNAAFPDLSEHSGEEIVYLEGRAFYPRYYKAGEGDSGGSSSAKRGLPFDRIVWMFHDQNVHVLCIPLEEEDLQETAMPKLPDPQDVMVIGIQREDYIEVLEMYRLDGE